MKKIKIKSMLRSGTCAVAILFFASLFSSCEKKIDFLTSSVVPAARGYITVDDDKNKNYKINIKVSNLAESSRLTPSKLTYVVWIVGVNSNAQNIGQIQTSDLSASLKTVSSFKPNRIFITAEDAGNVQYPSQTILTTASF